MIWYTYLLFQLGKFLNKVFDVCLTSIKYSQNDWLIKTNSSPIGEFIFILNTDWQRNNWMLIHHFCKSKQLKKIRIPSISIITDQWFNALDHVFLISNIAYSQQNWYVRFAVYSDWFTLISVLRPHNWRWDLRLREHELPSNSSSDYEMFITMILLALYRLLRGVENLHKGESQKLPLAPIIVNTQKCQDQ